MKENRLEPACITIALALCLAAGPLATTVAGSDLAASESTLKAAYLYQLPSFVTWPEDATSQSFRICFLGDGDLDGEIRALENRQIKGRKVELAGLQKASEAAGRCELLFVAAAVAEDPLARLEALREANVLTVGDAPDFAHDGGMIGFVRRGEKLNLEVHPATAERAGLKISAKLLELAVIVDSGGRVP